MTRRTGYLLTNDAPEAMDRFTAFATLFDPSTFRHLDGLGLAPGWRCWEVGAGGTSVVRAPGGAGRARRATCWPPTSTCRGPRARRRPTSRSSSTTSRADPPPGGPFDLVHARLVLVHVPERDAALANMVAALRPGGVLLVEDADPALQPLSCLEETGPEQVLANRLRRGFRALLAERGVDLAYGRTLPRRLRAAGLVDVAADAAFPVSDPACNHLEMATINLVRDQLLDHGIATEAEIEQHLANVAAGQARPGPAADDLLLGPPASRLTGTGGVRGSRRASQHPGGIGGCPTLRAPESRRRGPSRSSTRPWRAGSPAASRPGRPPPQSAAWPHIAAGRDVLVASPTGSGKTLTGFLVAIDAAYRAAEAGRPRRGRARGALHLAAAGARRRRAREPPRPAGRDPGGGGPARATPTPGCASPCAPATRRRPSGPP